MHSTSAATRGKRRSSKEENVRPRAATTAPSRNRANNPTSRRRAKRRRAHSREESPRDACNAATASSAKPDGGCGEGHKDVEGSEDAAGFTAPPRRKASAAKSAASKTLDFLYIDGKRKSQFEEKLVRWLSNRGRRKREDSPGQEPRRHSWRKYFVAAAFMYFGWLTAVSHLNDTLFPLLEDTGGYPLEYIMEKVVLPTAKEYLPQSVYARVDYATKAIVTRSQDWKEQSAFFLGLSKKDGGLLYSSPESIFQRGLQLKEKEGITAKHPLVLIPGIISTGLESWSVHPCAQKYFRARLWGTMNMFRAMVLDKECWLSHMKLDPDTGLDPEGVKLRASQGLEAADYLVPGYWVWGTMLIVEIA